MVNSNPTDMKWYSLFACMPVLVVLNHTALGQSQKVKDPFPTYDQIRQKDHDTFDYINTNGSTRRVEKATINLFNYSPGTVTYILNGKPSDDVNYVKRVLSGKQKSIENIAIGEPDQTGKRVFKINYEAVP